MSMFKDRPEHFRDVALLNSTTNEVEWHTVEEIHATEKNKWKDWYCAAGVQSVYIDFDGNMFSGTCQVGGWYGNVFRGLNEDNNIFEWKKCTRASCQCGADMHSFKCKSKSQVPRIPTKLEEVYLELDKIKATNVAQVKSEDFVASDAIRTRKVVVWDLGRRCNYNCTYCFPEIHNNYEAHKSLGSLKFAADFLRRVWAVDYPIKFVITGGEPTANPAFLDFVKYLREPYVLKWQTGPQRVWDWVHTTTNGSRLPEYYEEMMGLSDIGFSAHLEYLKEPQILDKFISNITRCVKLKTDNETARLNWLGARLMLKPGQLELARTVWDRISQIPDVRQHCVRTISLLHSNTAKGELLNYTQEEKDFLKNVDL